MSRSLLPPSLPIRRLRRLLGAVGTTCCAGATLPWRLLRVPCLVRAVIKGNVSFNSGEFWFGNEQEGIDAG